MGGQEPCKSAHILIAARAGFYWAGGLFDAQKSRFLASNCFSGFALQYLLRPPCSPLKTGWAVNEVQLNGSTIKSMYTVIDTPIFLHYAAQVWSQDERSEFVEWIAANPESGDVVPGAGGMRKVRWGRAGMGKRGGARVVYFNRLARGEVVLYLAYAKAKFDNMRPEFLQKLKEQFDG